VAAGRQAVVENLIVDCGIDAAEPLQVYLKALSSEDSLRVLATARMLSLILVRDLQERKLEVEFELHKEAALQIADRCCRLPEKYRLTETAGEIYDLLSYCAENLKDQKVWEALKKLSENQSRPERWRGDDPTEEELALVLPENAVFIVGFSRRVDTPFGELLKAYYFSDLTTEELIEHFEEVTGREALETPSTRSRVETSYFIRNWSSPDGYERVLELGITVFEGKGDFEEGGFGEVRMTGKSMFRITRLQ
jgi:hypothetical protein